MNGYVAIPPSHPWYGLSDYTCAPLDEVQVHGGLTWAGEFEDKTWATRTNRQWWIGFDCAHSGDYCPGLEATTKALLAVPVLGETLSRLRDGSPFEPVDQYKTVEYVRNECERLAKQAMDTFRTSRQANQNAGDG